MNQKDREAIAKLNTHIKYIRESIDDIKRNMEEIAKITRKHERDITTIKLNLTNHLSQHQRDLKLLTLFVSIVSFIISMVVRFI